MPRSRPPNRAIGFVADENVPQPIVHRLRSDGFEVLAIADQGTGASDTDVLRAADAARRVLITQDADFGRLVAAQTRSVTGIVFIRLARLSLSQQVERVSAVITARRHTLLGAFTVIEPGRVRVRRLK